MTLSIKIIKRPSNPKLEFAQVRAEVIKQLQPVGRQHVSQRAAVVSGWQDAHRPEFESRVFATEKQVTLTVHIKNADKSLGKYGGTIKDLWGWINKGTKAHTIVPRFSTILRFAIGNSIIYARSVRHPGTVGKKHDERINERLKSAFLAAVDRGIKLGFKRTR